MGFFDDVVNKSVPQGSSLAKPLMLAFIALLASGALAPGASPAPGADAGGVLGGLGGLLGRFHESGLGEVAKSWVGSGQNQPISPGSLGSALGPSIVKALAEKTGDVRTGSDCATVASFTRLRRQADAAGPPSDAGRAYPARWLSFTSRCEAARRS